MNGFLALMCWKVIRERPRHSFSIKVTQNIFKSVLLRALVGVPSGELSNNGQKGFPLLYGGEPEPRLSAIHGVWTTAKEGCKSQVSSWYDFIFILWTIILYIPTSWGLTQLDFDLTQPRGLCSVGDDILGPCITHSGTEEAAFIFHST